MISTVFFDIDDTLYPEKTAKVRAEVDVARHIADELGFELSKTYSDFIEAKMNVLKSSDSDPERNNRVKWIERLLEVLGDESLDARELGNLYWETMLEKIEPFPEVSLVLPGLSEKYCLWAVTDELMEIQKRKVEVLGLKDCFKGFVSSEHVGHTKPDVRLFEYALSMASAKASESAMVGDNPRKDVAGANRAGMTSLFYRVGKYYYYPLEGEAKPDYIIKNYLELPGILAKA